MYLFPRSFLFNTFLLVSFLRTNWLPRNERSRTLSAHPTYRFPRVFSLSRFAVTIVTFQTRLGRPRILFVSTVRLLFIFLLYALFIHVHLFPRVLFFFSSFWNYFFYADKSQNNNFEMTKIICKKAVKSNRSDIISGKNRDE